MSNLSFQTGVAEWLLQCFGPEISGDKLERSDRFIEEALELVQAVGYPEERITALIQYVYARPIGEPRQEVGGVMVTLAAFCWSYGIDLDEAARKELARIWTKIEAIRAKQAGKPTGSALPIAVQPDRNQFYSCLPCTWSSSDVDCCTYPADAIYVDNASTRFCADCANQYRGGTRHMRKLSEILSLARPHLDAGFAAPEGIERLTPDEAWTELCETPDVTSPEEYPDHALITLEQLRWFMERAIPVATAWPIETDDQVEALARECEWNNRPYMTAKDYSIWCERMRKFACLANGGGQ